jgi:hypothetical protein
MVFCTEFWMGGGLESRCVGRVYGADGAVRRTVPQFLYVMSEAKKSRTKEGESDGTRLKHRKEFGSKTSNGSSFGKQGVDVGMVLTN